MEISDIIFKIVKGLFFSIIYLAISYLVLYLAIYFDWRWNVNMIWFLIVSIAYCILFDKNDNNKVNILGVILNIVLIVISNLKSEPQLWIYIVINTIVCLNIIITCIKNDT